MSVSPSVSPRRFLPFASQFLRPAASAAAIPETGEKKLPSLPFSREVREETMRGKGFDVTARPRTRQPTERLETAGEGEPRVDWSARRAPAPVSANGSSERPLFFRFLAFPAVLFTRAKNFRRYRGRGRFFPRARNKKNNDNKTAKGTKRKLRETGASAEIGSEGRAGGTGSSLYLGVQRKKGRRKRIAIWWPQRCQSSSRSKWEAVPK